MLRGSSSQGSFFIGKDGMEETSQNISIEKVKPLYYAQLCPNCNGRTTVGYDRRPCPTCGDTGTPGVIIVPTGEGMNGRRNYDHNENI